MKPSDLRIGNIVCECEALIIPMDAVGIRIFQKEHLDGEGPNFTPVEIDKHWLTRWGFTRKRVKATGIAEWDTWTKGPLKIELFGTYKYTREFHIIVNRRRIDIAYLHEVQNWYYLLTGEELPFRSLETPKGGV